MIYFLRKCEWKNGLPPKTEVHFYHINHPEGIPQQAEGLYHIAPAIYHISMRKYFTFPSGKISLGVAKIPFRNSLLAACFHWSGLFDELFPALGAGNGDFSLALWHTQDLFTVAALKITVGLPFCPGSLLGRKPASDPACKTQIILPFQLPLADIF